MALSWTVTKEQLLSVMSVLDMVPSRPGILSSEFIRVAKITDNAISFCLSSEICGTVSLKGIGSWPLKKEFFLDRRLFLPFINAAKIIKSKSDFVFTESENQLVIRQGKRVAKFNKGTDVQGYGELEKKKALASIELDDVTKGLVTCARECATTDSSVPELNCVYIKQRKDTLELYATQQKMMYKAATQVKAKMIEPIPFPLYLVNLLTSTHLKRIEWRTKEVVLWFDCGCLWQTVSSKARQHFPFDAINKRMLEAEEMLVSFKVNSIRFGDIMARIGSYLGSVRRIEWILNLKAEKGALEIELTTHLPQGLFRERIKLDTPVKQSFEIDWPLDKMLPIFTYISAYEKDITVCFSKEGRGYLKTKHIQLLIARREK